MSGVFLNDAGHRVSPGRSALRGIAGSRPCHRYSEEGVMRVARARQRQNFNENNLSKAQRLHASRVAFGVDALPRLLKLMKTTDEGVA